MGRAPKGSGGVNRIWWRASPQGTKYIGTCLKPAECAKQKLGAVAVCRQHTQATHNVFTTNITLSACVRYFAAQVDLATYRTATGDHQKRRLMMVLYGDR
eukprot:6213194-Pleurochrysis_carterae.AAC.1